jgi:hypothetical protein
MEDLHERRLSKQAPYRLIDALPDAVLPEVERYLMAIRDDPVLQAILAAPYDAGSEAAEEPAGVAEARAEGARGELIDDTDLVL